jgi:hypothetical protein
LALGLLLLLRLPVLSLPLPAFLTSWAGLWRADGGTFRVTNAFELHVALANATPGTQIELAAGTYFGNFSINRSGAPERQIVLRGNANAVIDGTTIASGVGLTIQADYWRIENLTVRNAKKGIVLDRASHNVLEDVRVDQVGEEGIRLRRFSSNNMLTGCVIARTGLLRPGYGEGIYIGTALSNWATDTGGQPDRSDRNQVNRCTFGPGVSAENIDIKEGTSEGVLSSNIFDASAISGENYADSVVDLKGNAYLLTGNRVSPGQSHLRRVDVQVHHKTGGWGYRNVFRDNHLRLDPKVAPVAISVPDVARQQPAPRTQARGVWHPFAAVAALRFSRGADFVRPVVHTGSLSKTRTARRQVEPSLPFSSQLQAAANVLPQTVNRAAIDVLRRIRG